jgi:hypothetical protein
MLTADYWIGRSGDGERLIFPEDAIDSVNRAIADRSPEMVSLAVVETLCSAAWVRQRIERYALPHGQVRFDAQGAEWSRDRYHALETARHLEAIPSNARARRAVVVQKILMRGFPTMELLTKERGDHEFDRLQEGELDVAEPLLILHESRDAAWWFVQARNYCGWVRKEGVAEIARDDDWEQLNRPGQFAVCVASFADLTVDAETVTVMMGTRLPVVSSRSGVLTLRVPRRGADGGACFVECAVSDESDFTIGYLRPTKRNLFTQIFKMLGEPYSWGGLVEGGRDCTRLLLDTYRTFGLFLPRNSSQQREVGVEILDVSRHVDDPMAVWSEAVAALEPGTPVYSDGHAMLYLGSEGGYHYIIHSASRLQNLPTAGRKNRFGVVVTGASDLRDGLSSIRWARRFSV